MFPLRSLVLPGLLSLLACAVPSRGADEPLRDQAAKTLRKGVDFFRKQVATEGGYLWRYSADLKRREGENKATDTQAWVQPPGTPSVGMAYLAAFEATADRYYLDAARETAHALVRGQLRSGGWDYRIEFDPKARKKAAYRTDRGNEKGRNVTTLDDNTTQAALRLLMFVDRALGFKDEKVHEAALFGLDSLLMAQYPNGAWPQRYDAFPDPKKFPVKKAGYPETWSRTWAKIDYRGYYTLNDNTLADAVATLLEAERIYGSGKYQDAVKRAGDFLILAQMPQPQPAWAQQYDSSMHPAWARKFEPPAVTGGESQGALLALLTIYRATGDKHYLGPIPGALKYLEQSRLPDGRLARFYELKTNKPLYFTRKYELTYKDDDVPTHYGFKVSSKLDRIRREYERLKALKPERLRKPPVRKPVAVSSTLVRQVKTIIAAQDDRGAWLEKGRLRSDRTDAPDGRIIDCRTFIKNVGTLAAYLKASKP
jgi:PelA/Pel-15E family pectate lyase